MMTAYDYSAQRWVTGEPARQLRIARCRDAIDVLNGPDAERYVQLCCPESSVRAERLVYAAALADLTAVQS